jgi:hypothetical protein
MNTTINQNLQKWLDSLANDWNTTTQQAILLIDKDHQEIPNRALYYPKISALLKTSDWKGYKLAEIARNCYVLGNRFDAIRFNNFINTGLEAETVIHELIDDFPVQDEKIAPRIDNFIAKAVKIAYTDPQKNFDFAGAACLSSLLLSALYPERFVDFRQKRWFEFATQLDYPLPKSKATYGEKLIWAGHFACEIAETDTFLNYWPGYKYPLWVVAGICWHINWLRNSSDDFGDDETLSFPEGYKKVILHYYYERSKALVSKAKKRAFERDPFLRCEVCGFSFREAYGVAGINVIEAHHTVPIASLTPGSRTRIEDIALLCSNCHRMIHSSGKKTLTISELSDLLNNPRI